MNSSPAQAVAKLAADPDLVRQFRKACGRGPGRQNLLSALATFERSLITPGSRVGGNLYQRNSALRGTDGSSPQIVRVPSLRNVATTAPYFHDGSAPTFLRTLTGTYRGRPVGASQ